MHILVEAAGEAFWPSSSDSGNEMGVYTEAELEDNENRPEERPSVHNTTISCTIASRLTSKTQSQPAPHMQDTILRTGSQNGKFHIEVAGACTWRRWADP